MYRLLIVTLSLVLCWMQPVTASTDNQPHFKQDDYALVFFFRSDCSYCHLFAPTLKQFEQQTGLTTYAFSLDNKGMTGFEVPIPVTKEIAETFFDNPRSITVPATFLINVNSRKFARMAQGQVSLHDLQTTYSQIRRDPAVIEALRP
ncbi:type-F conjugative transfer system pilin assembly thiol-disulfide isomerase TrbB [Photobacterium profundum]|uniref:Thiol-disulfide isomerase [Photobacterium profundum SS9] n=1 Tax=Photobacterium profundum (strain SS9) TaxID=298386 RepID=Q6LW82_PHOPR|nr:type-F conjugative transfer system pilin assembly thiol-disulfide isomerase TrbB [Photobacterium profundum]CAG17953.1 putative Thiol-disulfide isomerase [Photobacterium profundum SS9]